MFKWYRLFNLDQFNALDVVSAEFSVLLEGVGVKTVLVTKGNFVSCTVDDTFLSIGLNSQNPVRYGERAIFQDANSDVWLGVYDAD